AGAWRPGGCCRSSSGCCSSRRCGAPPESTSRAPPRHSPAGAAVLSAGAEAGTRGKRAVYEARIEPFTPVGRAAIERHHEDSLEGRRHDIEEGEIERSRDYANHRRGPAQDTEYPRDGEQAKQNAETEVTRDFFSPPTFEEINRPFE